jgi:hypothetical protein
MLTALLPFWSAHGRAGPVESFPLLTTRSLTLEMRWLMPISRLIHSARYAAFALYLFTTGINGWLMTDREIVMVQKSNAFRRSGISWLYAGAHCSVKGKLRVFSNSRRRDAARILDSHSENTFRLTSGVLVTD